MKNGIVLCINDRVVVMLAEKITERPLSPQQSWGE